MPLPFPYEYDPTGVLLDNKLVNELHVVVPPTDPELSNFIVPRAAPFFVLGLHIRTGALITDPELTEGVDYILTHHFVEATQSLSKGVYGSIMFLDRAYTGNVYLTYQTIGGAYTLDDYSIIENLTRSLYNLRVVTWTQIAGLPAAFPPVSHPHDVADLTGMAEVVTILEGIRDELIALGVSVVPLNNAFQNHIASNAAHTKAAVGLGLLDNFATAVLADIQALANNKYVTPDMVKAAIDLYAAGAGSAVPDATTTIKGIVRRATQIEGINGANVNAYITPSVLAAVLGSALGGSGFATSAQLSDEANLRAGADNALQIVINATNLALSNLTTALSDETTARINGDNALTLALTGMESSAWLCCSGVLPRTVKLFLKKPGIWINGAFRMSATPTLNMSAHPINTFFHIYAYWDGTDVQLEASLTGYTTEITGVKAYTKLGDPTRTLVGLWFLDDNNMDYSRSVYGDRRQYNGNFDPEDVAPHPYVAKVMDPTLSYPFNCTVLSAEYTNPSPTSDLPDFEMPVLFFANEQMGVRYRIHIRYTTITGTAHGMVRLVVGTPTTGYLNIVDLLLWDPAGGSDDRTNMVTVDGHALIGRFNAAGINNIRMRAARNHDPDGGQGAGNYIAAKVDSRIVQVADYGGKITLVDPSTSVARDLIPDNNRTFLQLIYDEPSAFFYLTPNY